jgi:hypothetical protein
MECYVILWEEHMHTCVYIPNEIGLNIFQKAKFVFLFVFSIFYFFFFLILLFVCAYKEKAKFEL